ncbi:MAG: DUF1080 domain-containing protein, partial [Planctomycetia bacterium]
GRRTSRGTELPPGGPVEDGTLVRAAEGAGDIMTEEQFDAFELAVDYRIAPRGNSGLMFHVTEEGAAPWQTGPEIQILDNAGGADSQRAGWLYQLYKPDTDATRPAGEWNELRVRIAPEKSETFMNGVKYYEFVKGHADWNERVAKSKFGKLPGFGKAAKGHICLQDHGDTVAFRNIKIRPLAAPR